MQNNIGMKKMYLSPQSEVLELRTEGMIASSDVATNNMVIAIANDYSFSGSNAETAEW